MHSRIWLAFLGKFDFHFKKELEVHMNDRKVQVSYKDRRVNAEKGRMSPPGHPPIVFDKMGAALSKLREPSLY
jgi:hypothetical protein